MVTQVTGEISTLGIAVDSQGNIFAADYKNHPICKVTPNGNSWVVTTIAGTVGVSGSADGTGGAAGFNLPTGIAVDSAGNLYVADTGNNVIRNLSLSGTNWVVATIGGTAGVPGGMNGIGSAARFYRPQGITVDSAGRIFVADTSNNRITEGILLPSFVTPGTLPVGTLGLTYSQTLQVTNATAPCAWFIVSGALPSGLTLGATSGTISGTPTVAGTATFSVQVTDASGLSAQQGFTLVVTSPYATWLAANNLPADGSGNGALTACPAGDGITNLAKFALGIAANTPGYQGRFSAATATDNGNTYLGLTYTRPDPAPAGVSYTAESGGNLTPGSLSNANTLELPSSPSGGLRTITVRDTIAVGTTPRRFLRMKFTAP